MKVKIFLHIGIPKTGTSIIQNFLDINRVILYNKFSCLYPNLDDKAYCKGRFHNHCKLWSSINNDSKRFIEEIKNIIDFAKINKIEKIILSCEDWSNKPGLKIVDHFSKIIEGDNEISVYPVIYLRRPDHLLESSWKQWGIKQGISLDEYIARHIKNSSYKRYYSVLLKWERLIPLKNIYVRVYEKEQLQNGLIWDFLDIIGIHYNCHKWIGTENTNTAINSGFNQDVMEILSLCGNFLSKSAHDNKLFNLFFDLLDDEFKKEPFTSYNFLSPKQRLKVLESNDEYMRIIANRYLNAKKNIMFQEPWPRSNEPWQPYNGLSIEKLVPILIKMIYTQQEIIKSNQDKLENQYLVVKAELDAIHANWGWKMLRKSFRFIKKLLPGK